MLTGQTTCLYLWTFSNFIDRRGYGRVPRWTLLVRDFKLDLSNIGFPKLLVQNQHVLFTWFEYVEYCRGSKLIHWLWSQLWFWQLPNKWSIWWKLNPACLSNTSCQGNSESFSSKKICVNRLYPFSYFGATGGYVCSVWQPGCGKGKEKLGRTLPTGLGNRNFTRVLWWHAGSDLKPCGQL